MRHFPALNATPHAGHPLALDRIVANGESRTSRPHGTPSMRALAELSFDFVWHLMFTDDKQLDQDLAMRSLENLSDGFSSMSDEEKRAFIAVADERKARLSQCPMPTATRRYVWPPKSRRSFSIMSFPGSSSSSSKSPWRRMQATVWCRFAAERTHAARLLLDGFRQPGDDLDFKIEAIQPGDADACQGRVRRFAPKLGN